MFYEDDPLDATALSVHMGEYYPQTVECSPARFELDHCGL